MYYLVTVDHNSMAVHLTGSECEVLSAVLWMGLMIYWGMLGSEGNGNVRSECEEDEGTDCEDGESDTEWYR